MYVVSRGGTFGTLERTYVSDVTGETCAVISWGRFGWITPVLYSDVFHLRSSYEGQAREEAEAIMDALMSGYDVGRYPWQR